MIETIQLVNYRCFKNVKIKFKDITIIVGKNNAGKSSLLEALRLVSLAIRKAGHTTYKELPREFKAPVREKGFRLNVEKLKVDLRGIVYYYTDETAQIIVKMVGGITIHIYANSEYVYAVLYDEEKRNVKTKARAAELNIESVDILPQIGLIKEIEKKLSNETVEADRESYLSSRHFRNEVLQFQEEYWDEFVRLAETTWEGLKIREIFLDYENDNQISLFVSDNNFPAEIGLMGSGLQMWLQIMWFLSRTKESRTVILDEPDVYMHPDLQRKLLKIIKSRYPQVIIATHSIEMISEVEARNIMMIEKRRKNMSYASDLKAVQSIIDDIGAVSNLSLTRIGNYRKCIFVEGKDLEFLSKIAEVTFPDCKETLNSIPHVSIGGFNNLSRAFGAANLFFDETKGQIQCYCILDSDYFPDDFINEQYKKAEENHLQLHIWKRKEIENYLLEPAVLYRLIKRNTESYDEFIKKLDNLADEFRDEVFDQYAEHVKKYQRSLDVGSANKIARKYLEKNWTNLEEKLALVGGKAFLKRLHKWYRDEYGVQISNIQILKSFKKSDLSKEIQDVIEVLSNEG